MVKRQLSLFIDICIMFSPLGQEAIGTMVIVLFAIVGYIYVFTMKAEQPRMKRLRNCARNC